MRRLRSRVLPLVTIVVLALPRRGWAQASARELRLETGAAWLAEHGLPTSAAGTLGGSVLLASTHAAFAAASLGACAAGARCAVQGLATGAVYANAGTRQRVEVALTASGIGVEGQLPVTGAMLQVRDYVGSSRAAIYGGIGGGVAHGTTTGASSVAEIGALWNGSRQQTLAAARFMRAPQVSPLAASTGAPTSFSDIHAQWSGHSDQLEASIGGGVRVALGPADTRHDAWGGVSLVRWLGAYAGVVVAAGRALEDVTRGTPAARYASVSLRLRLGGSGAAKPRPSAGPTIAVAVDGETRHITVRADSAIHVELMADFTDWQPVSLTSDGGAWRLDAKVQPGPHRLLVRTDGGTWRPPANVPVVQDDFGGTVGLLTVP